MPPARDFYSNSYFAGRVTARPFNERALSVPRQVGKLFWKIYCQKFEQGELQLRHEEHRESRPGVQRGRRPLH